MSDVCSRWNLLVILLSFGGMLGCGGMKGTQVASAAVDFGQLSAAPARLSFGNLTAGSGGVSKPLVLTNQGGSEITINQVSVSGTGYALSGPSVPLILATGQSASFTVTFTPPSTPPSAGTANGNVAITSSAANAVLSVSLVSTVVAPGSLTVSSDPVSFGTLQVGANQGQSVAITNSGGASVVVSQVTVSGAGFTMTPVSMPMTLAPSQSANLNITFAPQSSGTVNGVLSIVSNASDSTLSVPLSGTAVTPAGLTLSPSSFSFGSVQTGSSQSLPATLTNLGSSSVTVSQASFTGAGYSVSGLNLPLTLQSGRSASFNVLFSPQSAGADNLSLTITSNASNPSLVAAVSGTGIAAGALSASPTSLSFGNVQTGSSQTLSEKLSNTGDASFTLTQVTAGAAYSVSGLSLPMTLAAGASTSFSIVFSPQSAGSSNATLAITSSASTSAFHVPLAGAGVTPGTLSANPSSFGSVQMGSTSTQTATLTDSGGSSLTVRQANLTGAGFSMSGLSMPLTLTAGQSFTFSLSFAPQQAGAANGTIVFVSNASDATLEMALSGTGVAPGQFTVTPSSFTFGSVTVGASKSLTATLSATGGTVTVTSAAVSSTEFTLSGPSLPITIGSGGTASFTLTFTPQASGSATANLSFTTAGSNSPFTAALTGTGAAPVQHSVNLLWDASSSSVTGYNVYRGGQSGGQYSKMNAAPITGTTYTDSSVQAGETYYYVTTSVGTDGMESGYSNQGIAVIPTP